MRHQIKLRALIVIIDLICYPLIAIAAFNQLLGNNIYEFTTSGLSLFFFGTWEGVILLILSDDQLISLNEDKGLRKKHRVAACVLMGFWVISVPIVGGIINSEGNKVGIGLGYYYLAAAWVGFLVATLFAFNLKRPEKIVEREVRAVMAGVDRVEDGVERVSEDMKYVIDQLAEVIENQISIHEDLSRRMEKYKAQKVFLENQLEDSSSRGDTEEKTRIQKKLDAILEKIAQSTMEIQESIETLAKNTEKILENQEITEEFLKKHLQSNWEKIKDIFSDYKKGKITKKGLIFEVIKISGPSVLKGFLKLRKIVPPIPS